MALLTLLMLPIVCGASFVYFFGHFVRGQEPAAGRIWVLALALLPALVLCLASAGDTYASTSTTDLASWIEAVGTAATLSAAVVAAHYVARAYAVERGRETDRLEDVKKEQASFVAAWPSERAMDASTGKRMLPSSDVKRGLTVGTAPRCP